MKKLLLGLALLGLAACGSTETAEYSTEGVTVSGEFLFEGPNTLQGASPAILSEITNQLGVEEDALKAVYLTSATISFEADTLRDQVQSALVQWVSDDLDLVSVATKSPLPATDPVTMTTSQEEDLLPYLEAESSTVVVDVNLGTDMDVLTAVLNLSFQVEYKN